MTQLRRAWLISASAFLLLTCAQAHAQYKPKVSVQTASGGSSGSALIVINERPAVRLLTPNGQLSPSQRAEIAATRLRSLINSGADWRQVQGKAVSASSANLVWGGTTILIVTSAEAKAHSSRASDLADSWAATVRTLLSMPPLALTPSTLIVPVGETRQVLVGGIARGDILGADSDPEITSTSVTPDLRSLVVRGLALGSSTITVERGGVTATVAVSVRKFAGSVSAPQNVLVTGRPAPAKLCEELAALEVSKRVIAEPGAKVTVLPATQKMLDLSEDTQASLTFPVRIEGDGYIPVASSATVRIVNQRLVRKPVGNLFYSNSPERVEKYANLFAGRLQLDQPTRLLYHHQNMMGKRLAFNVVLVNHSSAPAQVHVIRGCPEPEIDTVAVGYKAGARFMESLLPEIGYVVELPPASRVAVYSRMLDKIQTASGIMQFRQLQGEPALVQVSADLPEDGRLAERIPLQANPFDSRLTMSPWVFPFPTKELEASYTVGKSWTFIRVGRHALKDAEQGQELFGNYGVLYDIRLQIENPTAQRKNVDVLFEPSAGIASGVFTIDGKYVKVTHLMPPKEVSLARYSLEPNQKKTISIKTIPLGGSNYPATIVVRS